ncbi:MAG: helix-turn-helix domain-containing protein [Nitritalea sp.]
MKKLHLVSNMQPDSLIRTINKLESQELFKISRFKPLIKKTRPHTHEGYYELIYLAEGEGFHWVETEKFQIKAPDVFFLKPGQLHFWQFTSIPSGFVLMFKEAFIDPLKEGRLLQQVQQLGAITRLADWKDPVVAPILEDILRYAQSPTPQQEVLIKGYLAVLLAKLAIQLQAGEQVGREQPLCDRFLSLLATQQPPLHRVAAYAELLQTSPQNLNQACKKKTGSTASEHISAQLILEAKRAILHTDQNINQIADYLLFNDASYFVKFFKKHTGETPHQFRARYFGD